MSFFKSTLKSLLCCASAAGFGSVANAMTQSVIAAVVGISPVVAAFHPVTVAVGCVMGLVCYASLLASKRIRKTHQSPRKRIYQYPERLCVCNIYVVDI
jgi:membrane protein implicated in regulation of membrane protease activity